MSATPEPTAGIPAEPVFYANAELTVAYPAAWRNALKAREEALPIALCVANAGIPPAEVSEKQELLDAMRFLMTGMGRFVSFADVQALLQKHFPAATDGAQP